MSRVHCLECGNQVVVDPRGLCPDGHEVGTSGARIEHAIGQETVHPDEPEPWVYSIDAEEVTVPARPPAVGTLLSANGNANGNGNSNGAGPARQARPLRAPGLTDDASEDGSGDAESLLRELHSLAALDESLAEQGRGPAPANGHTSHRGPDPSATAPPPPPADATPAPAADTIVPPATDATVPPATDTTPRPTRGDPSAIADAFAELSALDVPSSTPATPGAGTSGHARSTASQAGGDGAHPSPPSPPTGSRDHSDAAAAAGDQGRSGALREGPLFDRDGEPDPAPDPSGEVAGDRNVVDAERGEQAPEREYEATLHVVATPRRSRRSAPSSGPAPQPDDAGTSATVPPPTPVPDRPSGAAEDHGPTTNGHRVAVPGTGDGPDLSSFTARGGSGGHKTRGRRRRLAR